MSFFCWSTSDNSLPVNVSLQLAIPLSNAFLKIRLSVVLSLSNARGDSSVNAYIKEGY